MVSRWLVLGVVLAVVGAPSWLALAAGLGVALLHRGPAVPDLKRWTTRVLQVGVVLLGAGMDLERVLRVGADGARVTLASLLLTLALAWLIGRLLRVDRDTSLLVGVGTAICGGSAIAAVASALEPPAERTSVALAIVFVLNAVALLLFPPLGAALGLTQPQLGLWAALAIHDTSSVVGAAMSMGPEALEVATTTKLARALWIVPLTLAIVLVRRTGRLRDVKWPWFIAGFVGLAALFTWVPSLAPVGPTVRLVGQRALVLALYLVGLGLSKDALTKVGLRPLIQGVVLWACVVAGSLAWVMY